MMNILYRDEKLNNVSGSNTLQLPTFDSLPVVNEQGSTFFNIGDNTLYVSDGAAWIPITPAPPLTIRTFGAYLDETMVNTDGNIKYNQFSTRFTNSNPPLAYNPATGVYTVQTSGFYQINVDTQILSPIPDPTVPPAYDVYVKYDGNPLGGTICYFPDNGAGDVRYDQYCQNIVLYLQAGKQLSVYLEKTGISPDPLIVYPSGTFTVILISEV